MNKVELEAINNIVNSDILSELNTGDGNKSMSNAIADIKAKGAEGNQGKSVAQSNQAAQGPGEANPQQRRENSVKQVNSPASKEVQKLSEPYRTLATVVERYTELMFQAIKPGQNTTLDQVTDYLNKAKKDLDKILATDRFMALTNAIAERLPDVRSTTRNKQQ